MRDSIVVLEQWNVSFNDIDQRLIYDAKQDRIIHQYKGKYGVEWVDDAFTSTDDIYANVYLLDFNTTERLVSLITDLHRSAAFGLDDNAKKYVEEQVIELCGLIGINYLNCLP